MYIYIDIYISKFHKYIYIYINLDMDELLKLCYHPGW